MHRGARTSTEQQKDPGVLAYLFFLFTTWLVIHPIAAGVLGAGLLSLFFGGWVRVAAIVAVIAFAVLGFVFRDRLKRYRENMRLQFRWEGAPGRVGLAAELGLVPLASRRVPRVKRVPTKQGFDVEIVCPPGVPTSLVIDKSVEIGEALGAVEVTAEKIRGTSKVVVHCVSHDVLAEDVAADWVVDSHPAVSDDSPVDPYTVIPPLSDSPYWENSLDDGREDDSDDSPAR